MAASYCSKGLARLAQELSNHVYIASINNYLSTCVFIALKLRCFIRRTIVLTKIVIDPHIPAMTEKEIVLETIRALSSDCSLEEIAERIEFMAAVKKGLDQLDRAGGIPHDEVKNQLASSLTS